jgi:hypothetical protein
VTEGTSKHLLRFPTRYREPTVADAKIPAQLVDPGTIPVGREPKTIQNWDFYDGALVAIAVSDGKDLDIPGTGVMVAPGLVLTATHLLREHYEALAAESRSLYCVGIRPEGRADIWVMKTLRYPEDESDITFLGVEPSWDITEDPYISCFPLTTRQPQVGETLTLVGFRFPDVSINDDLEHVDGIPVVARGDLYASAGEVAQIYEYRRDASMAPFPMLEVDCGTVGSMSGGAAIDQNGHVVGIISSGWQDTEPPSNVASIIHPLMFGVNLLWPPGVYEPETPLLDLPSDRITIVGRDAVELTGTQSLIYRPWS